MFARCSTAAALPPLQRTRVMGENNPEQPACVDAQGRAPTGPVIHHGTPMTPRPALINVCSPRLSEDGLTELPGRAMCVSFYRPDDVEVVEEISPAIMFRQWRVQQVARCGQTRRGMGRCPEGLYAILSLAGAASEVRAMGGHSGPAGCAQPAQRRTVRRLAIRPVLRRPALAYGWPVTAAPTALLAIRQSSIGMDWRSEEGAGWLSSLPRTHEGSESNPRRKMAAHPYDARYRRGLRLPIRQRGFDKSCTERAPL